MSIVVFGAAGQLGSEFVYTLGNKAVPLGRTSVDITDAVAVDRTLDHIKPEAVINCAAFNYVDAAESEHAAALEGNFLAPAQLARLCASHGYRLVHFSTDYVFGGEDRSKPYVETDRPSPVNFYGTTKLMGEQAVLSLNRDALVLRVAHLFGGTTSDVKRANLVQRFLTAAERGETIRVSDKQTLNPTSVVDIVETTMRLLKANAAGLYHTTGAGSCTAAEFARAVFEFAGVKADIVNATDSRPARRPAYSALDNARLRAEGYPELPHWREALARYVKRLRR